MKKIIISVLGFMALTACSGNFYNVPTPEYDPAKYDVLATESKTATGVMLFQFIPIGQNNKFERAVEYLRTKYNGDAVTNVSVQERWFWAYVLNGYKTEVTATILKKKK